MLVMVLWATVSARVVVWTKVRARVMVEIKVRANGRVLITSAIRIVHARVRVYGVLDVVVVVRPQMVVVVRPQVVVVRVWVALPLPDRLQAV